MVNTPAIFVNGKKTKMVCATDIAVLGGRNVKKLRK
jgi:hypothetical protein